MAFAALTISLPESASSTAPGAAACTARQMAAASTGSLAAMLYSAPWGLTWCSGTPAASQNAFSAPIWYITSASSAAAKALQIRQSRVCTHLHAVLFAQQNALLHHGRVARVEPAGDVRAGHIGQNFGIHADGVRAEALAQVAV